MFFILYVLWIIFNGKITFEILWLGVLIAGGIYLLCVKCFDYDAKKELGYAKKSLLFLEYFWLLLKEIFKANFVVVKIILSSKKVQPVLVEFESDLETSLAKVVLSHSITLTPGTITVELIDSKFYVHCLDESLAEGLETSSFVHLLKKIEH